MPAVTRVGDANTGHDSCPPTTLASGSPDVTVNGIAVGRVGDAYNPHGCKAHPTHVGTIASGSATVFINGKAAGRVGDAVSCGGTVAAGSGNVDIGDSSKVSDSIQSEIFQAVVEANKTTYPEDEVILAVPEIAQAVASKISGANQKGWELLSQLFSKWLSGNAYVINKEDQQSGDVDFYQADLWDWAYNFERFFVAYQNFVQGGIFSKNGIAELVNSIKKKYPELWNNKSSFDFSFTDEPIKNWEKYYFNLTSVPALGLGSGLYPDGLTAAFAGHTIRALADGSVEYNATTNEYKITITKVCLFIHDLFSFNESSQNYFYWSKNKKEFSLSSGDTYYNLSNSLINAFRDRYGKGKDFVVLSLLYEVSELAGTAFYYQ